MSKARTSNAYCLAPDHAAWRQQRWNWVRIRAARSVAQIVPYTGEPDMARAVHRGSAVYNEPEAQALQGFRSQGRPEAEKEVGSRVRLTELPAPCARSGPESRLTLS